MTRLFRLAFVALLALVALSAASPSFAGHWVVSYTRSGNTYYTLGAGEWATYPDPLTINPDLGVEGTTELPMQNQGLPAASVVGTLNATLTWVPWYSGDTVPAYVDVQIQKIAKVTCERSDMYDTSSIFVDTGDASYTDTVWGSPYDPDFSVYMIERKTLYTIRLYSSVGLITHATMEASGSNSMSGSTYSEVWFKITPQ